MLTLEEKLYIIENSKSFKELNKDVLPVVHKENYYFVSYSHKDYKKVMKDVLLLEDMGINIWYDSDMNIGDNWEELAEMFISKFQCKGIIFYLSENSILSKACNKEIEYVLENDKQFFSINIPLDNLNDLSGHEMLLELIKRGKQVNNDLISLFKKTFSSNMLYLSYNDSIEHKAEKIKEFVDEDVFSIHIGDSILNKTCKITSCKDNSLVKLTLKENYQINDEEDQENFGKLYSLSGIDRCTFANLFKLKEVVLPEIRLTLNDYSFANCHKLKTINLDNPDITLGNYVFSNCTNLQIENVNCENINDGVFYNCKSIKTLNVNSAFGKNAFYGCSNLKKIYCNNISYEIPESSFAKCKSLKEIYLNNDVPNTIIKDPNYFSKIRLHSSIFDGCESLETFTIYGNVVLDKASYLFSQCINLKTVNIDVLNLEKIPNGMFHNCYNLETINGLSNVKIIDSSAFFRCMKLKSFDTSEVLFIGDKAFMGTSITELYLPNVISIDYSAFGLNKELKIVKIGKNLERLNTRIFQECDNLKELEILSRNFEFHPSYTFDGIYPEIITLCDLSLLKALINNMNNIKILYIEKDLIDVYELRNILYIDFKSVDSDKDGFDKFII